MALTRSQLDGMQCGHPDCQEAHEEAFYLHGRCHLQSPLWVSYQRTTGAITVTCAECRKTVAEIAVAESPAVG